MAKLKILVLHPKEWVEFSNDKVEVRHVSIGGNTPKRLDGSVSFDGIGEVATISGLDNLKSVVEDYLPDLFLFGIHFNFERNDLLELKNINSKMLICMHYTDQRRGVSVEVLKYQNLIDVLLINNQDLVDHDKYFGFGFCNVETFYDGFDPMKYYPKEVETSHDIFFGGNDHHGLYTTIRKKGQKPPEALNFSHGKFRHDLLIEINKFYRLLLYGKYGWDEKQFKIQPMRYHPNYLSILRKAKIILATSVEPRYMLFMRRLFRSVASGRLLLTEYITGMEIEFINHKHLVWFKTIDESLDLIRYYLDHEQEREDIAFEGRNYLLSKHTYKHRLYDFVRVVRKYI